MRSVLDDRCNGAHTAPKESSPLWDNAWTAAHLTDSGYLTVILRKLEARVKGMSNYAVTGVPELDARLRRGDLLVLDGGMGTELEARGVPMDSDAWSAVANIEHEAAVEQAHVDYLTAGADIIIANTFGAGYYALEAAGLVARFEELNRRGIEAAIRARDLVASDRPVAVAGSISPMSGGALIRVADQTKENLLTAYRRQAAVLADAGADLIVTEMIQSLEWHGLAVQASVETGLPVWLGVSAGSMAATGQVPMLEFPDVMLDEVLAGLVELPIRAVSVMHTDIAAVADALGVVQRIWHGPVAVYPHCGEYAPPSWTFHGLDPDEFGAHALAWNKGGIQIIGGCCGIRPNHIQGMREYLKPTASG